MQSLDVNVCRSCCGDLKQICVLIFLLGESETCQFYDIYISIGSDEFSAIKMPSLYEAHNIWSVSGTLE